MIKNNIKLIFAGFLFLPLTLFAKVDPQLDWKRIQTPHFEIIFSSQNTELAKKYAVYSETAYDLLIPIFKEGPKKTAVVIDDSTDLSNGYANFLPYPHIVVYPVLPAPDDTNSSYDHWGLELMIHEYTHILSIYPAHGIYTPFKYIFGNAVRPIAVTPRWYLEGLAIAMESRFTTLGRLRSPSKEAAIKAFLKDKRLYSMTLSKINQSPDHWPFGGTPYLFGSLLWQKAIDEKGEEVIYKLIQSNSRKLLFRLNSSFDDYFETNVEDFLTEMYVEAEENFKPKQNNFAKKIELSKKIRVIDIALSPNQKYLLSLQNHLDHGTHIVLYKRGQDNQFDFNSGKKLTGVLSTKKIGWFSDSKKIYFESLSRGYDRYNNYYSIYTYDIEKKIKTKIPNTLRGIFPHISNDDQMLTFIRAGAGTTELVTSNLKGENQTVLLKPKLEVRLSFPTYLDNENILFTMRDFQGAQKLFSINTNSKKVKKIETDDKTIFKIKKSGKNFIFTSLKNGTKNLYASKPPFFNFKPLSNTDTAVSTGDWDRLTKEVFFTELTSDGYKLFSLNKVNLPSENPAQVSKVMPYSWPETKHPFKPSLKTKDLKVEDYSPLKYMLPRHWIPYAFNVNDGFVFQGTTFIQDPLGKNAYSLGLSYDTITESPSYNFSYQNNSTELNLLAAYSFFNEPIGSSSDDHFERTSVLLGASFNLPGASNSWVGSLSWSHRETSLNSTGESLDKLTGPIAVLSYGNTRGLGRNLKTGFVSFSVSHNHNLDLDDFLSFDMTRLNLLYNFNHFLPKQHALLFRLNGAYSDNLPLDNTLISFGARTIGGNFIGNLINSNVLMRGYSSGAFAAQKMAVGSLSYDLPLGGPIYKGPGLTPVFFKDLRLNIFTDAISFKGQYLFTPDDTPASFKATDFDEVFIGSGMELKLSTNMFYHLPVDFILGLYYGFNTEASGGFVPFISFSMGGIGALANE